MGCSTAASSGGGSSTSCETEREDGAGEAGGACASCCSRHDRRSSHEARGRCKEGIERREQQVERRVGKSFGKACQGDAGTRGCKETDTGEPRQSCQGRGGAQDE